MSALDDVKDYMEFWGWTNGGNPGSVKKDLRGQIIATHGDKNWAADVENACNTLKRITDRCEPRHEGEDLSPAQEPPL